MAERTRLRSDRLLEALSLSLSPARLFPSVSNCLYLSAWLLVHPFLWWSIAFSVYLRLYLSLSLPIYLSIKRCILSFYPFICLLIILPLHLSIQLSVFLSTFLTFHRSVYISMYLSKCPSIHPSIHVSPTLFMWEPSGRNIDKEVAAEAENENRQQHTGTLSMTFVRRIISNFLRHVWNTFCSLVAKSRIHCPCQAKPHPNFKKWSETVKFLTLLTCECTSRLISGPDMCCS
jgi:hypothetical protein